MSQAEQLKQELSGISDQELSQLLPEELQRIESILSARPAPQLTGATSQPSEQFRALSTISPLVDPAGVLPPEETFEDISEPEFDASGIGGLSGSVVGGLKGAQKAQQLSAALPAPLRGAATIAGGAAGTFLGTAGGDILESGVEAGLGLEGAPSDVKQALGQAVSLGSEEAVLDATLNAVFGTAGKGFQLLRAQANELAPKVSALLKEGGSNASIGQLTDNVMYTGLEKLTRGAIVGGGKFKKLDIAQDDAIISYVRDYSKAYTDVAAEELTDTFAGKLILDVVKGGREAHKSAAKPLYELVDELSGGIAVDVSGVRKVALDRLAELERTANIGRTTEGGPFLDNVASLSDELSFADTQVVRSDLLEQQRLLSDTKADQAVARNISKMVEKIDLALDTTAKLGNPEAVTALKKANRFWRIGKKRFNNQLITDIIKRDDLASKISAKVFRSGNREEVIALRRAIKSASVIDKSINFNKTWGKMQGHYLQTLLPHTVDDIATSSILKLHKDKKLRKTLSGVFTKPQRENIIEMSKVLDTIVSTRKATTGLLNLRQIGGAAQIAAAGGAAATEGVSLGEGTAILGIPLLFSAIATDPKASKLFLRWAKSKQGTALKVTALTKLATHLGVKESDIDPEDVTSSPTP